MCSAKENASESLSCLLPGFAQRTQTLRNRQVLKVMCHEIMQAVLRPFAMILQLLSFHELRTPCLAFAPCFCSAFRLPMMFPWQFGCQQCFCLFAVCGKSLPGSAVVMTTAAPQAENDVVLSPFRDAATLNGCPLTLACESLAQNLFYLLP